MKVDLMLLQRIYELILRRATGTPAQMAEKLEISYRYLYINIDYLKKTFGAPIVYSRSRETFYFTKKWEFYVGDLQNVKASLIKNILNSIKVRSSVIK